MNTRPSALVRPLIRKLHAYVPGEQPKIKGLIKLNTNENPYPPSPKVLRAIRAAVDGRLRLYPSPTAQPVRDALAEFHRCGSENIIVGNGSDELLALAVRAFVEPKPLSARAPSRREMSKSIVQFFRPSYSLYPVLAATHGATVSSVALKPDFDLPSLAELRRSGQWNFDAALTFVTTPNAPSGRGYPTARLEELCRAQRGVVVLDEAYVDFAPDHAFDLALRYPHVLIARTFSKAYSLCFQRIGYFAGHPDLIGALDKIRDSYNVNGLGQIAAAVTLSDLNYYRRNFRKVIATRQRVSTELERLGFAIFPSQTNFILVEPPKHTAEEWLSELRTRRILVRWFSSEECRPYLRISIGTDAEMDRLLRAARQILGS